MTALMSKSQGEAATCAVFNPFDGSITGEVPVTAPADLPQIMARQAPAVMDVWRNFSRFLMSEMCTSTAGRSEALRASRRARLVWG